MWFLPTQMFFSSKLDPLLPGRFYFPSQHITLPQPTTRQLTTASPELWKVHNAPGLLLIVSSGQTC